MKRLIFSVILTVLLALPCYAMMTPVPMGQMTDPAVETFCKRVQDDGGRVVDHESASKLAKMIKQSGVWDNVKFLGDANFAYKSGVTTTVATLYDLSGNNNDATQATVAKQPVWTANVQNGKYGMVFDGGDDYLQTSTIPSLPQPNTLICVIKNTQTDFSAQSKIFICESSGVVSLYSMIATSFLSFYSGLAEISSSISTSLNPQVITAVYNGASSILYKNGVSIASGNPGSSALDDILIGIHSSLESTFSYKGAMLSIFLYSGALSTTQRTAIEGFFNAYSAIY